MPGIYVKFVYQQKRGVTFYTKSLEMLPPVQVSKFEVNVCTKKTGNIQTAILGLTDGSLQQTSEPHFPLYFPHMHFLLL